MGEEGGWRVVGGEGRSADTYTHRAQLGLAFTASTPPAWGGGSGREGGAGEGGGLERGR